MQARFARCVRGLRSVSTFQRGPHDPYNALTRRFKPSAEKKGPLAGWEVSIKENISMKDVATTCSSRMLQEYRAPYNAAVVDRLEASGALITSRNNCDEFAMGGLNVHSVYGPVANPAIYEDVRNPDFTKHEPRAPGGSSGGAAAAVAGELCRVALGTDTGGSVRLPGSFCGVYGFKPSYGLISRWGVVSYADSLDTVGIFARDVKDVAAVLDVIAGDDARDATCVDNTMRMQIAELTDARISEIGVPGKPLHGLRVGVPAEMYPAELDERVAYIADDVLEALQSLGATIVPLRIPAMEQSISAYYVLALAEASSNLGRFDGMRYGLSVPDQGTFHETIAAARAEGFGDEVQKRILLGTYAVTTEAWDSFYMSAIAARFALVQQLAAQWSGLDLRMTRTQNENGVDIMVHPTSLRGAPRLSDNPAAEYAQDVLTTWANLVGAPVLSAPAAQMLEDTDGARLPIGIGAGTM
ncbi:uncharacterized protein MJAP1_003878 [Malassezia japonica]|uniref:Glutamyl-tRNA(Gln) amidotransferase subunit A, mitochondrial n=1 Tax=Malassezia japonica TaxID=223818 RepID=A0AAF0JBI2_9BASI|nr:uncharacterized protein MJAP1_003878 [Malassezia japonica]WFD40887.1 hypothetical protein MJAP1_003878 [Malassezia japonica]